MHGRCTDIWCSDLPPGRRRRPKTGPVPEAVSFCSPHSHLRRVVSVGSGNQDVFPTCCCKSLLGSHLSSGGEGARMSAAQNRACPRSCVASACPRSCFASAVHFLTLSSLRVCLRGTRDTLISFFYLFTLHPAHCPLLDTPPTFLPHSSSSSPLSM